MAIVSTTWFTSFLASEVISIVYAALLAIWIRRQTTKKA